MHPLLALWQGYSLANAVTAVKLSRNSVEAIRYHDIVWLQVREATGPNVIRQVLGEVEMHLLSVVMLSWTYLMPLV